MGTLYGVISTVYMPTAYGALPSTIWEGLLLADYSVLRKRRLMSLEGTCWPGHVWEGREPCVTASVGFRIFSFGEEKQRRSVVALTMKSANPPLLPRHTRDLYSVHTPDTARPRLGTRA